MNQFMSNFVCEGFSSCSTEIWPYSSQVLLQGGSASQTEIEHVLCAISWLSTLFWGKKRWSKLSVKFTNDIKILVGQAVLALLIKPCIILFLSITQEPLSLLKFKYHFWILQIIYSRIGYLYFFSKKKWKKCWQFGIAHKTCSKLVWGAVPP